MSGEPQEPSSTGYCGRQEDATFHNHRRYLLSQWQRGRYSLAALATMAAWRFRLCAGCPRNLADSLSGAELLRDVAQKQTYSMVQIHQEFLSLSLVRQTLKSHIHRGGNNLEMKKKANKSQQYYYHADYLLNSIMESSETQNELICTYKKLSRSLY